MSTSPALLSGNIFLALDNPLAIRDFAVAPFPTTSITQVLKVKLYVYR